MYDRFMRLKRLLIALGVSAVLLGILEGLAGIGLPPTPSGAERIVSRVHPTRGWRPVPFQRKTLPGGIEASLNALGYRDAEIGPKRPGERRVLFLGDSVTTGLEVPEGETFVRRLEASARAKGRDLRAVNAAVWGYGLYQEAALLSEDFDAVAPDAVVLVFCWNDVVGVLPQRQGGIPRWMAPLADLAFRTDLYRRVVFWQERGARAEADLAARSAPEASLLSDPIERLYWTGLWGDRPRADWGATAAHLARMRETCRARGVPFAVVLMPLPLQCRASLFPEGGQDAPARRLREDPALAGAAWIDLREPLGAAGGKALFLDHTHLNAEGHAAAAGLLEPRLREAGILPE